MKRKLIPGVWIMLSAALCCAFAAQAQPVLFEQPLSPRIANYDIDVRLQPDNRTLKASQVLTWHNKTNTTITELQFHLYLNAFRNSESTFMKSSGGTHRGNTISRNGWGFIEVDRIALASGADVTAKMEYIQPDDDNEHDKTVFRLPLDKPLRPGQSIELNMDFTAKLPTPPFARTGAKEEYLFVGQWFPKIGVHVDGKWNCHQFHENSEFFADYGVYNVHITVPEENIVGATGIEVEVKDNGDGTKTHFYHAEDVHDFAWTTSPEFVEVKGKAQDVEILVLMQPDHAYQGERHLQAAITAVEYHQNWYGDYPYPNLTVVDPRRGASGSGGMEYPTLITAGTSYGVPEGVRVVELVIIHEFGHNYWYHLLASNEFEESWMDEGINTYTEIQIMNDAYGPIGDSFDVFGLKINDLQIQRGQYINVADVDPMVRRAWDYYSGSSYGVNSYAKPGVVLTTLQNYLGNEKMLEVMRTYVERWRFKHPKTQDFIDVANEVAGEDLTWFFDQAFFSNAVVDYSVDAVFTRQVRDGRGFDFNLSVDEEATTGAADDSVQATDGANGDAENNDADVKDEEKENQKMYYSGVNIRRLGDFHFPVEVELAFDDGEKIRETWDGRELWKKFRYTKPAKLVSATVDPDHKIIIDINYTNNSRAVDAPSAGANKLATRMLFWLQFLMDQPDFLNFLTVMPN